MKYVPMSDQVEDYPSLLAYLDDRGLAEVDLQVLGIAATAGTDGELARRVEAELGWTMPYFAENVRCLVNDPHAQQEMPLFLASLAERFPGPPLLHAWDAVDAFTRSNHV